MKQFLQKANKLLKKAYKALQEFARGSNAVIHHQI